MKIKHTVQNKVEHSFRTDKVGSLFDVDLNEKLAKSWEFDFPIEDNPWQLGLIVGASGSGKTTLAKHIFGNDSYHTGFDWADKPIIEAFSDEYSIDQITEALSKVGFSSPPSWLLPFSKLSNGQKFRAEIARCVLEGQDKIVFDEFTSVVDRTVAKVGSVAVGKYIKKNNKQFVAVSCHYDIEEWLQPDWVLDVNTQTFKWGCLRRPQLELSIYPVHRKAWTLFKEHHYLSSSISTAAQCFMVFIKDIPVAFSSYINFPHPKLKNCKRAHRTVVLPDYQGLGIGNRLSDYVADYCIKKGHKFISTSSHPSFINTRIKSKLWKMVSKPKLAGTSISKLGKDLHKGDKRVTASFRYIGDVKG